MGRRFLNSKGFSLAELMVGMGVSMVIAMIASFAFMLAFDVYIRSIRQYETEMEMSALMYGLRSTLVTAPYLTYGGPVAPADNATTNRGAGGNVGFGHIFSITDTIPNAGYTGEPRIVAQFTRERSYSDVAGRIEGVQIVYQRPDAGARQSGAIYIDTEINPAAGGWVRLSPVNAPFMYTRLTNFEVNEVKVIDAQGRSVLNTVSTGNVCLDSTGGAVSCVDQQVLSAELSMTMRYYVMGPARDFQWCNRNRFAANGACDYSVNRGYKSFDIDRKMRIVFSNNALEQGEYLPRRAFGNVYFFAPWIRQRGAYEVK